LVLLFIAPPVGALCSIGFFGWGLVLAFSQKSRLKALLDEHDGAVRRVEAENAARMEAWASSNPKWHNEHRNRIAKREVISADLAGLELSITELDSRAGENFRRVSAELRSMKGVYEQAKNAYTDEVADLVRRSGQLQLERYLDLQLIGPARIPGITISRVMSLRSFGIESALDVDRLKAIKVPGVGEKSIFRLLAWKGELARNFKPAPGLPDSERGLVDQRHVGKLRQMEAVLSAGPGKLSAILGQHRSKRHASLGRVLALVDRYEQANADVAIMEDTLKSASE
jgi:DNA-binding helix-hairpin-helix protein with protein kinase domain